MHLIVKKAFLNFARGDIISDAVKIKKYLSAGYEKFVTKISEQSKGKV